MGNVECRIELPGSPSVEQYDQLHAGMNELGLERKLRRDGKTYSLPTGYYLGEKVYSSLNTVQILSLKIAALGLKIVGAPCKVVLTPIGDLSTINFSGLEEDVSFESQLGALGLFPLYASNSRNNI